ncbi:endonuclease/exonuclease/phosphatase family protein [Sphingobacterium hungaricum]|uniref:Endonuclease n=1 Tax=Sphingobacterium hungaricum TaxID=2082723 RepID=A0A928UUY8_9SPHI|nr:endonuclease/exonuclease/phosphatase family protein [Sphingobacterium hungaricum]MBE8713197.1 endonuclease [Sphingobacterium hungaricum]
MTKKSIFRKNLGFFSKTIFIVNVFAILALLLSYSAAYINPKSFWPIAFFGLGYLPILLINVGFVIYWVLRKPKLALFSLIPILFGWNLMTKHINFNGSDSADSTADVRVMSFNVHLFKPAKHVEANVKSETIDLINEVNPDVICFQEFYSRIKGSKKFTDELLAKSELKHVYFAPAVENSHEGYGQAIFSKYPIINSGMIKKNEFGINRIIYADVLKDKDTIRVYNVHLRSFALQNEDKEFIQNPSNSTESDKKISTRLGLKIKEAFTLRSNQAESLREHIKETTHPSVVMGDFNDTPMSYSVNLIGKNMLNAFQEKGNGWGVTHYEMLPLFQIDYILCSPQFAVNDYHIVKKKLSDHYPIWADLSFKNQD